MKLTSLLVVFAAGLGIGVGALYLKVQSQTAEMAALRQETSQLQQARAKVEADQASGAQADSEELSRLRKENEELLRLRNEVQQLRAEKKTLNQQVQTVQQQVQSVQQQALTAQQQAQAAQAQIQSQAASVPGTITNMTAAQMEAFRKRYGITPATAPVTPEQQQKMACLNNLRQIDGAVQQWALENQRQQRSLVSARDILPYLAGNALPACPAGGAYTIVSVGIAPVCNISGHQLGR